MRRSTWTNYNFKGTKLLFWGNEVTFGGNKIINVCRILSPHRLRRNTSRTRWTFACTCRVESQPGQLGQTHSYYFRNHVPPFHPCSTVQYINWSLSRVYVRVRLVLSGQFWSSKMKLLRVFWKSASYSPSNVVKQSSGGKLCVVYKMCVLLHTGKKWIHCLHPLEASFA